jgi:hypothetical protein
MSTLLDTVMTGLTMFYPASWVLVKLTESLKAKYQSSFPMACSVLDHGGAMSSG